MPITPYVRPQETITQILRATPAPSVSRRNPLVIGPQYLLGNIDAANRYEHDVTDLSTALAYTYADADGVATELDLDLYEVDLNTVKLYAENLEVRVSHASSAVSGLRGTTNTVITPASGAVFFTGPLGDLSGNLNERPLRIGDVLYITVADITVGTFTTTFANDRVIFASYHGLKVGDKVRVTTSAADLPDGLAIDTDYYVKTATGPGAGSHYVTLSATLGGATLDILDDGTGTHTLRLLPAPYRRTIVGFTKNSSGQATEALLNGIVPGAPGSAVTFYAVSLYTGVLDADVLNTTTYDAIVPAADEVVFDNFTFQKAVFGVDASGADCAAVIPTGHQGKISVYFRAVRLTTETEGVITINTLSDLDQLGTLHIDNWLAYGAYQAFKGNQSSKIYVIRTSGDTVEDFTAALDKVRSTDFYYALVPMTDVEAVKELVAAHCDELSNKYNRNFRRCYVGTETPSAFRIWGLKSTGDLRVCSVDDTNKRLVIDVDDQSISNFLTDLSVGDTLTIGATISGDEIVAGTGEDIVISNIISNSEVEYTGTATDGAGTVYATRKDSAANVVKYFSERSIGSRRCVNVWSDTPVTFGTASQVSANSVRLPIKFLAAEIAGLRCALLPQQGLTMTEVLSIDAAPGMYTRFTPEQLDTIASNGVMIVTQEIEGGEIFIRHQLTTKTDAGALAYEDNVGVIVDDFSYRVKDAFRKYLGRRNVTRETLAEIASTLKDLAIASTQESLANREIGPMVIRFFDENDKEGEVTVRVDGNLADHIVTYVRLRVPLPINGIDHYIDVETSVEL